jgi:hypothetical protein
MIARLMQRCALIAVMLLPAAAHAQQPERDKTSTREIRAEAFFISGERDFAFRGSVSSSTGSVKGFDGIIRNNTVGVTGRYMEGSFAGQPDLASLDANLIFLPPRLSLMAGFAIRALQSPIQTQRYDFLRLGVSSINHIGGTGLSTQVSGAYYKPLGTADAGALASSTTSMSGGMELEGSVLWQPATAKFYIQLGYRTEVLNTKTGTTTENAEQVRGIRLGAGIRLGGK